MAIRHTNLDLRAERSGRERKELMGIYAIFTTTGFNGAPWNGVGKGRDPRASNTRNQIEKEQLRKANEKEW